MLSKGFRDQEQEKLNEAFNSGLRLEYQPDVWEQKQRTTVDELLREAIGFSLSEVENNPTDVLLKRLQERKFQFDSYEKLGDVLLKILPLEPQEKQKDLAGKVVAIYESAQSESKTFSFGLSQKISTAKRIG